MVRMWLASLSSVVEMTTAYMVALYSYLLRTYVLTMNVGCGTTHARSMMTSLLTESLLI